MRRHKLATFAIRLVLVVAMACPAFAQQGMQGQGGQQRMQQQQQQGGSQRNQQLNRRIEQRLSRQLQGSRNLRVQYRQGTLALSGAVRNAQQKRQAEQMVRQIGGVNRVQNNLQVQGQQQQQQMQGRQQQQQQMQMQGGQQRRMQAQGAQQRNQQVTRRIQQRLQQQLQGARNLDVQYRQGTLVLSGRVRDQQQKRQAEQMVSRVGGVDRVVNRLQVQGQQQPGARQAFEPQRMQTGSDQQLRRQIQRQLWLDWFVDADQVDVQVRNGTATLSGTVDDPSAVQDAVQAAREAGAQRVINRLQTRESGDPGQQYYRQRFSRQTSPDQQTVQQAQSRLRQDLQNPEDIYVIYRDGVLVLYGTVPDRQQQRQAERSVRDIGTGRIDNRLYVENEGGWITDDDTLKEDIQEGYAWDWTVDGEDINIQVDNGVVTLTGYVDDPDEEGSAVENAYEAGARRVISRLQYTDEDWAEPWGGDFDYGSDIGYQADYDYDWDFDEPYGYDEEYGYDYGDEGYDYGYEDEDGWGWW